MAQPNPNTKSSLPLVPILLTLIVPVLISFLVLYEPANFNPVALPADYSFGPPISVPEVHDKILEVSKAVGEGLLPGPEDMAYDSVGGYLYTGCSDGWIRRVKLGDQEEVEDWVYVGGRPLGVALDADRSLLVAEANKGLGLLRVKLDKTIEFLTNEAEGVKFGLADGVDVSKDGVIYLSDASYKYNLDIHMLDIIEGRPHGRLVSFNPNTNQTLVLVNNLYFANGVAVSPDQRSIIFCETVLRRCRKYHIQGEKMGTVETFIEDLPGYPDNIRYDGEGYYWIGLPVGKIWEWDILLKYPLVRKLVFIIEKFVKIPQPVRNSGVLKVNLEGEAQLLYFDPKLAFVTGGLKVGNYLYYGSLLKSYISRVELSSDVTN